MVSQRLEYEIAMSAYRREQEHMQSLIRRMLGKHEGPRKPLKELRREIARQLDGISVSQMVIEAR